MLHVSKWIKLPILVDVEELRDLLNALAPFTLYQVQKVTQLGEGTISPTSFIDAYSHYVDALKGGIDPPMLPAVALSVSQDALTTISVANGRQLYQPRLPVILIQAHAFHYSDADQSFRSQLFGPDAVSWGIQLSYPQIYEEPQTYEIVSTRQLPNGPPFQLIQKWIRQRTRPTPFEIAGVRHNVPMRLGKGCFSWIHLHPHLKRMGITVAHIPKLSHSA